MANPDASFSAVLVPAQIDENPLYPRNDIGTAKLFLDLHSSIICLDVCGRKTLYSRVQNTVYGERILLYTSVQKEA